MVELAIAAPLLFTMLFGIVEYGTTWNNAISIRQGTREAARQGIVANFGPSASCTLTFGGGGVAPSADLQNLMCLAKSQVGLDPTKLRIRIILADTGLQNGGATWAIGNGLVVCTQYPLTSFTGLFAPFLNGHTLKTKTTFRIEQSSANPETEGYETDPSGNSWSWCTASSSSP